MKALTTRIALSAVAALALTALAGPAFAKDPVTTPTISCAPNGTEGSSVIDVTVCAPAGGTGLPGGFSVQWIPCDLYESGPDGLINLEDPADPVNADNNTWPASDDPRLCKASFSGKASGTNYNLAAGECLTVHVGNFTIDNPQGYSSTCEGPLNCDTCYVFRAFGHATSKYNRSANTGNCTSTTTSCPSTHFVGCTKSQGYFRNQGRVDGTDDCAVAALGANNPINGVTFTSGEQAAVYLAQTGPGSPSTLQKQLLALALNIAVSDGQCENKCNCETVTNEDGSTTTTCQPYPSGFGDAVICGIVDGVTPLAGATIFPVGSAAALNGQTVQQVFTTVNSGGTYGLSAGDLTALLNLLNLSFDGADGSCCGASAFGLNHLFEGSCP